MFPSGAPGNFDIRLSWTHSISHSWRFSSGSTSQGVPLFLLTICVIIDDVFDQQVVVAEDDRGVNLWEVSLQCLHLSWQYTKAGNARECHPTGGQKRREHSEDGSIIQPVIHPNRIISQLLELDWKQHCQFGQQRVDSDVERTISLRAVQMIQRSGVKQGKKNQPIAVHSAVTTLLWIRQFN